MYSTEYLSLWLVLAFYVVASITTYVLYARDKAAALRACRRTPERTLHILGLIGGWPGALVAQKVLRHKTRKQPFQTVYWATVIAHCSFVAWLFAR